MTTALLCLGCFIAGGTIGAMMMAFAVAAKHGDRQFNRGLIRFEARK